MKPPSRIGKELEELDAIIARAEKDYDSSEGWPLWLHEEIGGSPGTCTNTARWLARRLGGVIAGYHAEDNPEAALGACEGGHDFAIVGGRWLVDWWGLDTYGLTGFTGFGPTEGKRFSVRKRVYDMKDPKDARTVAKLYGDPGKWDIRQP